MRRHAKRYGKSPIFVLFTVCFIHLYKIYWVNNVVACIFFTGPFKRIHGQKLELESVLQVPNKTSDSYLTAKQKLKRFCLILFRQRCQEPGKRGLTV